MVDLLFVAHNRLAFTEATFPSLLANTNWDLVQKLHVLDDASTDGTCEYLAAGPYQMNFSIPAYTFKSEPFGGPVAAMNYAIDHAETDVLVKVDSDLVVCPGWLDALLSVLDAAPTIDVLGFEAGFGDGLAQADAPRSYRESSHIGGIGAFRTRVFARHRPKQHGRFFGLTEHMRRHARCAWLTPDLPCVLLDHLPFEPWLSLTQEYRDRGWSRSWPIYPQSMSPYWADLALA